MTLTPGALEQQVLDSYKGPRDALYLLVTSGFVNIEVILSELLCGPDVDRE